jgi:hypothetical protein
VRLPVPARGVVAQALAARTAAVPAEQIGRHPTLIEEDVRLDVPPRQPVAPLPPRCGDVRTRLLVGVYGFF